MGLTKLLKQRFLKFAPNHQTSHDDSSSWRTLFTSPTAILLYIACVKVVIHVLSNRQYGFHRDEFYYIVGGQHLAWGYVDHPPLTPLIARVASEVFGQTSLGGLRLFPALASGGIVLLTGIMARQMGGRLSTQVLVALAVIATPFFLLSNTMFQTVTFDQWWWVLGTYLLILLLKTNNPRYWLSIGLVAGFALQTKYTIVLWGVGMLAGIVLTQHRQMLKTPYPYLGGLIALAVFFPNLLWQLQNDFPSLEFTRNNNANWRAEASLADFALLQLVFLGLVLFPVALFGLVQLFSTQNITYRPLGWLVLSVLGIAVATQAKPYYIAPLYPLLIAAGMLGIERWLAARPNLASAKWIQYGLIVAVVVNGLSFVPIFMPILPLKTLVDTGIVEIHDEFAEMVGWPEMVAQVEDVYQTLPPDERVQAVILTGSYGEASALNVLGDGLPPAISGHNSYYLWGTNNASGDVVIAVRISESFLRQHFQSVELATIIEMPYNIENETFGAHVFICRGPRQPLSEMWTDFKHYN